MVLRTSLTCLLLAWCGLPACADTPNSVQGPDLAEIMASAAMDMAGPPGTRPPLPKFEDVTKDMVSKAGLFTLWHYPPDAKDKDSERLLCQIPSSFLGEKFMLSVSFSGGGFFTGFPLEERVVRWELLDRQLLLVEPETGFVVDESKTVSDVVRRTYPERIRAAVPLITKSPGGDPVIELGTMLKSNFADIEWTSFGLGAGGINPALSKWTKHKAFELNLEIGVELAERQMSPPGSYNKKLVHFSFWKLPETGYAPRIADDRIGYFLTANQDWSKPSDARDIFNRYIDRWQLVKRDPSLASCEPRQPIIFYIEKTVPVRFRRAVRDGILEWNRAFEKIGLVNAVEVRQQTDDNEWKDLDPEDMRYSFFRWIVTGAGFAMGPHRANPFTGQIYDADILFDDSMIRYFEHEAQTLFPSTAMAMKMRDPARAAFLEKCPQWQRPQRDWEHLIFGQPEKEVVHEAMRERMRQRGHVGCDHMEGMKHQLALGQAMLAGQPQEVIERFLYDVIKETVMHEVGHTLGLRHNFKASSVYSLDEIRRRRTTGEATVGSVMDYNPVLFFETNALDGRFITPTLGAYDHWAIEYGYRPADGTCEKPAEAGTPEVKETEPKKDKAAPEAATTVQLGGQEIPQEILAKLPEEARKLIVDKALQAGTPTAPPPAKPAAPAFSAASPGEAEMLHGIAARAAEPELAYATDEDTTFLGPDPRSNRFDMGSDPVEWAQSRMDLVNHRMDNVLEWAVKDRESWYHLRRAFVTLLVEKTFVLDYVGRYVGGQYFNRSRRGDPNAPPPFELVDPALQRKCLAFIETNLFKDEFFSFSPEVLNHLAAPRWWHAGMPISFTVDFPIHEYIALLQWWNLSDRLFPNNLRRIHDAELKCTGENKFTAAEYLQRMLNGVWSDVAKERAEQGTWTDASPFVSSIRRSLQREYLSLVELLVRFQPGILLSPDLHAMVQHSLRKLGQGIDRTVATGKLDFASEAHLASCKSRIDRMLEPKLEEYTWFGGGS